VRKLAIAALAVLPAFAQQTAPQPQQTFFTESIEVRVINVDVIVTKDGRPATGLTKDDFELLENGKPQTITNFLEIRSDEKAAAAKAPSQPSAAAAKPPLDPRARNIILFIDGTSVQPFLRDRALKPMNDFLHRAMRPGDHVMIIGWNPGLKVELPFTDDLAETSRALDRVFGTLTSAPRTQREFAEAKREIVDVASANTRRERDTVEKPSISLGITVAESYSAKASFEQSQRVEAIKSVLTSMRGLSGRNALVILTDQITHNPALPIFSFLESQKSLFADGDTFNAISEARTFEQSRLTSELADAANGVGVALYPISASGLAAGHESMSAENLNSEFISDTRPLITADEGLLTLRQIAGATGGVALTGSNNFNLIFDELAQDMTNYYSLGYHTEGRREDAVRSISVKLKKKGFNLRTRETFIEKSLTSEMQDAVAANLLYPVTKNDLNITLTAAGASSHSENDTRIVPVFIKIPTAALTLIPDGTDLVGQFSSFTAFMRRDGKVSAVKRLQHQLRFPADSLKRRKEITVRLDLAVDDKTEDVSVGIMDDASHVTGFARMGVS